MTDREWDSFARIYRELWKAYADMAMMRATLVAAEYAVRKDQPAELMNALSGWMNKLEKARDAEIYARYLGRGEAHITQAAPQHSDKLLIELFTQDPPQDFPWGYGRAR